MLTEEESGLGFITDPTLQEASTDCTKVLQLIGDGYNIKHRLPSIISLGKPDYVLFRYITAIENAI